MERRRMLYRPKPNYLNYLKSVSGKTLRKRNNIKKLLKEEKKLKICEEKRKARKLWTLTNFIAP